MFVRVAWSVVTIIVVFCVYTHAQLVSMVCLNCLCELSTGCDINARCNSKICGPFAITKHFWKDAGNITLPGKSSSDENETFKQCCKNIHCAGYTLQAYISKYARDCNGDGKINCDDFVRIYRFGSSGCSASLDSYYQDKYDSCLRTFPTK